MLSLIRGRRARLLLTMLGLWSIAVLGPLLELADEPAYVVAHGLSGFGTALFGLGLLVAVPVLGAAGCWAVDRLTGSGVACRLAVSLLAGLAAASLVRGSGWLALGFGITTTLAVLTFGWHERLAVTALATLAALIVWFGPTDVGAYIRSGGSDEGLAADVPHPAPIVLVVFDELPLHALLGSDLTVNADRFPAFADLARESTFFRLTSSVSPQTADSVPAMISGVEPRPELAPVSSNYPTSILSLFSATHEVFASEAFTRLCEGENCAGEAGRGHGMGLLFEDTAIYLADYLLPFYDNAAVRHSWSHFRAGDEGAGESIVADGWTATSEAARLRDLFTTERSGDRPPLYFLHSILPHQPYAMNTDGSVYLPIELPGSEGWTVWPEDERVRLVAWQRLQMQLVATDNLLGEAVGQLKRDGLWDDAIVVVASDHGLTFEPGPQRQPGGAPPETTAVPLFIKTPGASAVGRSDLSALTIDIAPTLVGLQGGHPEEFGFDGSDLFGDEIPEVRTNAYRSGGRDLTPVQNIEELEDLVALRSRWMSPDGGPSQVFRIGDSASLIGTRAPESPSRLEDASAILPLELAIRTSELSHLVGLVTVIGYDGDEVVIAVDDTIAGVGIRVSDSEFHVSLDPVLTPDPVASIEVLTPDGALIEGQ